MEKNKVVQFRVSAADKMAIKSLAKKNNTTVSNLLNKAVFSNILPPAEKIDHCLFLNGLLQKAYTAKALAKRGWAKP